MQSFFLYYLHYEKVFLRTFIFTITTATLCIPINSFATSKSWDVDGFVENATYHRFHGVGLSKSRSRLQLELSKSFGNIGIFKNVEFNGTFRGSYDAVYKLNDETYGRNSGSSVGFSNNAIPNLTTPWGTSPVGTGFADFGFSTQNNPNSGLAIVGDRLHGDDGGLRLATPTRPCDIDSRGCIDGYLDADEQELYAPEFNNRLDFIREAYFSGTIPLANKDKIKFTFGRQQVVWGRTDLFRVLDVINPVDYSQNNIYDELEDIRIPMGILTAEYSWGATAAFEDLNLQFLWKWEQFRPHTLGQAGTPNSIIDAGALFRAYKNCWDNGCTIGNFAANGTLSTDFPAHSVGIRQANLPDWKIKETDVGVRLEGVYKGVGFSLNALYYRSQLPSLNGGIPAIDPFVPGSPEIPRAYLPAADIVFPRIGLIGGSADLYLTSLKSTVRAEVAWTTGEEFADTTKTKLFSESDVIRWVIGIDRPTFIPIFNKNRAFLISGQVFGQHILEHTLEKSSAGYDVGMPDFKDNFIATLLIKGWYKNDRLSPQILAAYDVRAQAAVVGPSIDWIITDKWRFVAGANFKFGTNTHEFDDNRSAAPFPAIGGPAASTGSLTGTIPFGRFRSGPIGMASNEDEIQVSLRYRF